MRLIIFLLLYIPSLYAADLGVQGNVFPIEEESFQEMMKRRLSKVDLDKHNKIMEQKMFDKLFRPESAKIIPKATEYREFTYNPRFVTSHDIKDGDGNILFKKGTKVNPLDMNDFDRELWFIDALDEKQVTWYRRKVNKIDHKIRIILVGGSPLKLKERVKTEAYFDQNGALTKRFGIEHVPAIVYQKEGDKHLTVMELDI